MTDNWQAGGFALYVHWPFCEAKCPYCDFNSHVVRQIDQARWAQALASEVRRAAEETPGRVLSAIFFGGGTPSLMQPETVFTVLDAARAWVWANDIEITLEANPRSVEAERFHGFSQAGVTRVSLGVQALRSEDLKRLGRLHGVGEAKQAFEIARDVFDRVSFDLIYARQDQSTADWERELQEALSMAVDHLSLYQLTVEPGTAFWDRARLGGLKGLPDEDLSAEMYEVTQGVCEAAGFPAYEVSNHAKDGAQSRHNLVYWRYGDWVGVGPGAHGRLTLDKGRLATEAFRMPETWLESAELGSGEEMRRCLPAIDQTREHIMMGLRIREGLDLDRVGQDAVIWPKVAELIELDLMWRESNRLGVTLLGRLVLNSVVSEIVV